MLASEARAADEGRWLRLAAIAVIGAGAALLVVLSQARTFDHDEFEHVHSAWYVATGRVPYRDFFQNHHPLLHYLLAPLVRTDGAPTDLLNLRLTMLPLVAGLLASALGVAAAAGTSRRVGWTAVFLLLTMTTFVKTGIEIRPDVPFALCASVAIVLFLRALERPGAVLPAACGIALGVGLLFHQKAAVLVAVIAVVALGHWRLRGLVRVAWLVVPSLAAIASLAAWFAMRGALDDYWNMAWRFAALTTGRTPGRVLAKLARSLIQNSGFWLLAAAGVAIAITSRTAERRLRALGWLTLLFVAALVAAGRPVEQYLLPVFPALAVLAAWALDRWAGARPDWRRRLAAGCALVAAIPVSVLMGWTVPAHGAQIERMAFVLGLAPPGTSVHDGDIQFNVFRDDVHHMWFLAGRPVDTAAYNRIAGPRRAPYDACTAVKQRRPRVVSNVALDPGRCGVGEWYREALPGLYVWAFPASRPGP
jgi:hypothetical protein